MSPNKVGEFRTVLVDSCVLACRLVAQKPIVADGCIISVVFPEPQGPVRAQNSALSTESVTLRRTGETSLSSP